MNEYGKKVQLDEDLLPLMRKHRRKAMQELDRLLEMEPSEHVEHAMMPIIITLMGSEWVEEHCGGGHHGEKREHRDEEPHTKDYPMSR